MNLTDTLDTSNILSFRNARNCGLKSKQDQYQSWNVCLEA